MTSYDPFVRTELLKSAGRYDEEIAVRRSRMRGHHSVSVSAGAYLPAAEVYEVLGSTDAALDHYVRFKEMWKDRHPSLRGVVEAAQISITRLSAES